MNDKIKVVLAGGIAVSVVLTFVLWSAVILNKGDIFKGVFISAIAVIILAIAVLYLKRTYGSVRKGLPSEDEMSKKVITNALAKAYLISLYWLLAIGFASDGIIEFRDISQAIGAGIAGMAVIFLLCYFYFSRKEYVE